jgi:hypothetical protein
MYYKDLKKADTYFRVVTKAKKAIRGADARGSVAANTGESTRGQ